MVDIVWLCCVVVGFVSKGVVFVCGVGCLWIVEVGGGVGMEVVVLGIDWFDDYEVGCGGGVFEGVYLNSFEEVVFGVVEDDGGGSVKVVGEVVEGYDGVVDVVVVVGEEEVYVFVVGDEGLIDWVGVWVGDGVWE